MWMLREQIAVCSWKVGGVETWFWEEKNHRFCRRVGALITGEERETERRHCAGIAQEKHFPKATGWENYSGWLFQDFTTNGAQIWKLRSLSHRCVEPGWHTGAPPSCREGGQRPWGGQRGLRPPLVALGETAPFLRVHLGDVAWPLGNKELVGANVLLQSLP